MDNGYIRWWEEEELPRIQEIMESQKERFVDSIQGYPDEEDEEEED